MAKRYEKTLTSQTTRFLEMKLYKLYAYAVAYGVIEKEEVPWNAKNTIHIAKKKIRARIEETGEDIKTAEKMLRIETFERVLGGIRESPDTLQVAAINSALEMLTDTKLAKDWTKLLESNLEHKIQTREEVQRKLEEKKKAELLKKEKERLKSKYGIEARVN